MNTQNKLVVGIILALVIAVGSWFKAGSQGPQGPAGDTSLGATATLDGVDNPFVSIGGVKTWSGTQNFTATSTRVCRIKNPFSATSTIVSFSAKFGAGILGANKFSLGTSSAAAQGYATSSPALMFERTVASAVTNDSIGWQPELSSATTSLNVMSAIDPATGEVNARLAPGEYLVFAIGSTTAGTVNAAYYTGICSAVIRQQ